MRTTTGGYCSRCGRLTGNAHTVTCDLEDEIERLTAERDALKQDAERYRSTRYCVVHNIDPDYPGVNDNDSPMKQRFEEFDRMADSMIAKIGEVMAGEKP